MGTLSRRELVRAALDATSGGWPVGTLLGSLPRTARQRLLEMGVRRHYADTGQVLIREDDDSRAVFLLLTGVVKLTGNTCRNEALLAIRVGGDLIGEVSVFDNQPQPTTATTAGPTVARVVTQREFISVLTRNPELAIAITCSVMDKLRAATARQIDFVGCDAATRFARVLLELANRHGDQTRHGTVIQCPLTQMELASLSGAAEPTIHRVLHRLREDGIVATGYREIIVLDLPALRQRAYPHGAGIRSPNVACAPSGSRLQG
jgi:CRP/FNR family transcriptional regulator, cyclic AMP receptor protein